MHLKGLVWSVQGRARHTQGQDGTRQSRHLVYKNKNKNKNKNTDNTILCVCIQRCQMLMSSEKIGRQKLTKLGEVSLK